MRFRFTIRDLLWLVALVALATGWWLDHQRLSGPAQRWEAMFKGMRPGPVKVTVTPVEETK